MYVPSDYLTTYDPEYMEQHSDSSDFEDTCDPETNKTYNYTIHPNVRESKSKEEKNFLNQRIFDRNHLYRSVYCQSSKELWRAKTVVSRDTTEVDFQVRQTYQNMGQFADNTDHVDKRKSQRYKLIPCLSNMVGRSNNTKHVRINKENEAQHEYAENGYGHWSDCERKMRKFHKRQHCFAEQPVYAVKGCIYNQPIPFNQTRINKSPLSNIGTYKNQYSYELGQQSSSEHEINHGKQKRKKMKTVESEMRKIYLSEGKWQRNNEVQCPSRKAWVTPYPYQVFTNPYQYHTNEVGCLARSDSPRGNIMASTSSSFWDYVLDKFSKKSHRGDAKTPRGCQNVPTTRTRGSPEFFEYSVPNLQQEFHKQQNKVSNESCNCSQNSYPNAGQAPLGGKQSPPPKPINVPKILCKCPKDKQQNLQNHPEPQCSPCRKCQQPHDDVAQAVAQQYKGEILCIHNPPCILINGCLNLPPKDDKHLNAWPMMQEKVWSFQHGQASQYPPPSYDVRQCQIPESRKEKMVQSICNHNPPCEVVRTCVKPKFDPELHSPCIHVPMCEKMPECVLEQRMTSCDHKPRCLELPICTRNYIMLTAMEEVGVQANPSDSLCRHEPPCVMIPKCLGRLLCDSYIPCDSIPDCVHRPMCEMIPACCRKSPKEMVSVHC